MTRRQHPFTRENQRVRTRANLRLIAAPVAMAAAAAGLVALAAPADAASGPRATLRRGTLTVTGTAARDVIDINVDHDRLTVDFGFDGTVDAQFSMSRVLRVSVQLGEGNDGASLVGTGVGDVPITISGGPGDDSGGVVSTEDPFLAGVAPVTVFGDDGNDSFLAAVHAPATIDAGAGDDRVDGGGGQGIGPETISLGDGNDKFVSTLADNLRNRSDAVDAGTGQDTLEVRGSFATEAVRLSADAGHLLVLHDSGRIDADNVEDVSWIGFGGLDESGAGDTVIVDDLSGTDVVNFTPDFTDPLDGTGPNNSADALAVLGTSGVDHITVSGSGANITVAGLTPSVTPVNLDAQDTLQINTLDGDDVVDSSGLQPGLVQLRVF